MMKAVCRWAIRLEGVGEDPEIAVGIKGGTEAGRKWSEVHSEGSLVASETGKLGAPGDRFLWERSHPFSD